MATKEATYWNGGLPLLFVDMPVVGCGKRSVVEKVIATIRFDRTLVKVDFSRNTVLASCNMLVCWTSYYFYVEEWERLK